MTSEDKNNKKWTVLIHQAGDNNLSEECVFALKEMQTQGTNGYDVIVQFDPAGRGNPTRRFQFHGSGGDLEDKVIWRSDETDTGAPISLLNFLLKTTHDSSAKTDYYMLILSGHGNGTDEDYFLRDENRPNSLVPGSLSLHNLESVLCNKDLRSALGNKRIDILGLDSCNMSMAEVCYQLRDSVADILIGSEGYALNAGWPYGRLLKILNDNKGIKPRRLAKAIVSQYAEAYSDYHLGGLSVDI